MSAIELPFLASVNTAVFLSSVVEVWLIQTLIATGIPLPNVTSKTLAKVIEYCKKHVEAVNYIERHANEDNLKTRDAEFVKVDQDTLFDLILAAHYLDIKSLLDFTCKTVADVINGETPEEIQLQWQQAEISRT